jgi:hypothetical protein
MEHDEADRYDSDLYDIPELPLFNCAACQQVFSADTYPEDGLCSSCQWDQSPEAALKADREEWRREHPEEMRS